MNLHSLVDSFVKRYSGKSWFLNAKQITYPYEILGYVTFVGVPYYGTLSQSGGLVARVKRRQDNLVYLIPFMSAVEALAPNWVPRFNKFNIEFSDLTKEEEF